MKCCTLAYPCQSKMCLQTICFLAVTSSSQASRQTMILQIVNEDSKSHLRPGVSSCDVQATKNGIRKRRPKIGQRTSI